MHSHCRISSLVRLVAPRHPLCTCATSACRWAAYAATCGQARCAQARASCSPTCTWAGASRTHPSSRCLPRHLRLSSGRRWWSPTSCRRRPSPLRQRRRTSSARRQVRNVSFVLYSYYSTFAPWVQGTKGARGKAGHSTPTAACALSLRHGPAPAVRSVLLVSAPNLLLALAGSKRWLYWECLLAGRCPGRYQQQSSTRCLTERCHSTNVVAQDTSLWCGKSVATSSKTSSKQITKPS